MSTRKATPNKFSKTLQVQTELDRSLLRVQRSLLGPALQVRSAFTSQGTCRPRPRGPRRENLPDTLSYTSRVSILSHMAVSKGLQGQPLMCAAIVIFESAKLDANCILSPIATAGCVATSRTRRTAAHACSGTSGSAVDALIPVTRRRAKTQRRVAT